MNDKEIESCQEITTEYADLKHLVEEIEFEIKQYADQTNDAFVTLHDTTAYQIMLVLHMLIGKEEGKGNAKTPQQIINQTNTTTSEG